MNDYLLKKLVESFDGLEDLMAKYVNLDARLGRTSADLKYHCKNNCGACCLGPAETKEASVFEMLPMAIDLTAKGLGDIFLQRLESYANCDDHLCINFICTDQGNGFGHCGNYHNRPYICRLFGDSIFIAKNGRREPTFCHYLHEKYMSTNTEKKLSKQLPLMAEEAFGGRSLSPILGEQIYGINRALCEALKIVISKSDFINEYENGAIELKNTD